MSEYQCPFCGTIIALDKSTVSRYIADFVFSDVSLLARASKSPYSKESIRISFYKCPHCEKISITLQGIGDSVKDVFIHVHPQSSAKQFPDYVPIQIRKDYEEACAIVALSPKSSATLSRRCLQSMIRDFWGISKKTLYAEIEALEAVIPPTQKKVLHSLRGIGNIGAHPEADINTIIDIEPDDASKLIKVIEFFMNKWYVERHEQEKLFDEINGINDEMQSNRNS